jgi:hypothetical protein
MEIIQKEINLNEFKTYSTNDNLTVYINEIGTWVQNTGEYELGDEKYITYGRIVSDIVKPDFIGKDNPLYNYDTISIQSARRIYNRLNVFQNYIQFICENCNREVSQYVSDLITVSDTYWYYQGNETLPYFNFLVNEDQSDIKVYTLSQTNSFLDEVLTFYGLTIDDIVDVYDSDNNPDIEGWMSQYIESPNKFSIILGSILNYYTSWLNGYIVVDTQGQNNVQETTTVTLSGGGITASTDQAKAHAIVVEGKVIAIEIDELPAIQYTSNPTVSITSTSGSGATAHAQFMLELPIIEFEDSIQITSTEKLLSPGLTTQDVIGLLRYDLNNTITYKAIEWINRDKLCIKETFTNPGYDVYVPTNSSTLKLFTILQSYYEDMGMWSPAIKEWEPGKRYYLNDIVIYGGNCFILKNFQINDPKDDEGNQYFAGEYNADERVIYFDKYNKEGSTGYTKIDENGNPDLITSANGCGYTRWEYTILDNSNRSCASLPTMPTVVTQIHLQLDSQLAALKSYKTKTTAVKDFFDTEGFYRVATSGDKMYFYQSPGQATGTQYRSYIKGYKYFQTKVPPDGTFQITKEGDTSLVVTPIYEDGHDMITYVYVFNELANVSSGTIINPGIIYMETYHRYRIGVNEYTYDFDEDADVTYQTTTVGDPFPNKKDGQISYLPETHDFFPVIKEEYLMGVEEPPYVVDDVVVDRGVNYAWDKHLAFNEIHSLDQMKKYHNGGFYTIKKIDGNID